MADSSALERGQKRDQDLKRYSSERGFALATIKTPGLQSAGKWER
jgi:hypothetical protein